MTDEEARPTFKGVDIGERLCPLIDSQTIVTEDGPVEGQLFVKPEDGSVCFRQTTKEEPS